MYEEDLEINPQALDVEWLGQANLFMKYSRRLAQADLEARKKEEKLKTIRSDLILEAKADSDVVKDKEGRACKVTDTTIEAWYRTQKEYKEAKREMHIAQNNADMLRNAVSAFRMRRDALENLVRLNGQDYFASPKEPRDLGTEWGKRAKHKQATDKVKEHQEQGKSRRTK